MDEFEIIGASGDEPLFPPPGFGYRSAHLMVRGVSISYYDPPHCIYSNEYDCRLCEFFFPEDCPIPRDPTILADIMSLFDAYREYLVAYHRHKSQVIAAIRSELEQHGRPLHFSVLANMVADRHPGLSVTPSRVVRLMSACPEQFERFAAGVYGLVETPRA